MDCAYTLHTVPCIYFFGLFISSPLLCCYNADFVCSVPIFQLVWSAAVLCAQFHFSEQERNNNSSTFTELRVAIKIHVPNQRSSQSSAQKAFANSSNITIAIWNWTFHVMKSKKKPGLPLGFFCSFQLEDLDIVVMWRTPTSMNWGNKSVCHTDDDKFHFRKTVSFLHGIDSFRWLYRIQSLGWRACVCIQAYAYECTQYPCHAYSRIALTISSVSACMCSLIAKRLKFSRALYTGKRYISVQLCISFQGNVIAKRILAWNKRVHARHTHTHAVYSINHHSHPGVFWLIKNSMRT